MIKPIKISYQSTIKTALDLHPSSLQLQQQGKNVRWATQIERSLPIPRTS